MILNLFYGKDPREGLSVCCARYPSHLLFSLLMVVSFWMTLFYFTVAVLNFTFSYFFLVAHAADSWLGEIR